MEKADFIVPAPWGGSLVGWLLDGELTRLDFVFADEFTSTLAYKAAGKEAGETANGETASKAVDYANLLQSYFANAACWQADLPLILNGTPFQKRVWQQLIAIEVGETKSYGELAKLLGSSARAVGGACRANPIPIFVPCHRVVSKTGLGGFMGDIADKFDQFSSQSVALKIKKWLLAHEQG